MTKKKWYLNALHIPLSCHLAVTASNVANWKNFVTATNESIEEMKLNPELNKGGDAALYGEIGAIPDKGLVEYFLHFHSEAMLEVY